MVIPPGASAPVKWGDYSKQYVPTSQVKAQQAEFARTFVQNLAKATGQGRGKQTTQANTPQSRQAPADAFAEVRGLPLIDGQTLASLGERIQREGIGPLYEWAGQVNGLLEQVGKRLQTTERAAGTLVEGRSRAEFDGKMQNTIRTVAQEMFPGLDTSKHAVLNDFVQDVYLSYDPSDPTLETEFPGIVKSRLDGLLKLANDIAQHKLQQAREQKRQFLRPGGQGQPSGQGRGERMSHRDIARNLFAADART